jgi:thiol-disulfide isomerase/thioredoxin
LLADGTTAPDFTVNDPTGNPVHLSDFKGKVVVIDFWATWCGPCQESLPDTNKLAETYKGQNIVFLGVNTWDTDDAFKSWLPSHKALDAIQFVIDPNQSDKSIASSLYKVSGIPTQYVVDTKGDVAASFVGYSEGSPDLANAVKAALAVPVTVQPTP